MKRIIAVFVAAMALCSSASLYAESKVEAKPMCCQFLEMAGSSLTKEQSAKVTALHEDCAKAKCSAEAQAKFFKGTKALMTPEQIANCKAECKKAGRVGCPICSDAKPADDAHKGHNH